MAKKNSSDIRSIIQNELRNGKTKKQVSHELNLSYYLVKKHSKGFITPKIRISSELEQKIRHEVSNGKSKRQVAYELNISRDTVQKYTRDLGDSIFHLSKNLKPEIVEKIREQVKSGEPRFQIAKNLHIPYATVEMYTRDIPLNNEIEQQIIEKIRMNASKGMLKSKIAVELGVPYYLVVKYTKGIFERTKTISPDVIQQIRDKVKNGQSKMHTAKELNVSLKTVYKYSEDIKSRPYGGTRLTPELIKKIRTNIQDGNSKNQTAKELGVSLTAVYKYTEDIPRKMLITPRIYGRALLLLKKLMSEGYAFNTPDYGFKEYQFLKKQFPSIYRTKQHRKVIYYFDDKAKIATKAFFEQLNKKIISFQELNQMTKCFGVKLKNDEKTGLLLRNRSNRLSKNRGVQKQRPLREKDDSFSYFCIRSYCLFFAG